MVWQMGAAINGVFGVDMTDLRLLAFLSELKQNNNKEWFNPRKAEYKSLHQAFVEELESLAQEIAFFDQAVADHLSDPAVVKVFRIYRDVRFSKNKEPLKTTISGYISAGSERPAYYLQVEPGGSFAGGGIYRPSSPALRAIRAEIAETYEDLRAILHSPAFREVYPQGLDRNLVLKTAPRGYGVDHPAIEFLRLTSFTVLRPFSDQEVVSEGFREELMKTFEAQYPLHAYLDKALRRLDEAAV
jgi:uncharacterized protein (TIGR02453 family)